MDDNSDKGFSIPPKRGIGLNMPLIIIVSIVAIVVFAAISSAYTVPAGSVGVISTFGDVEEAESYPGLHFKMPFIQTVDVYSTKNNEYTMSSISSEGSVQGNDTNPTLTLEGLEVGIDLTVIYRINPAKASDIHQTIEKGDYVQVYVRPYTRAIVRQVIAKYESKSIYSEKRAIIQEEIFIELKDTLEDIGVIIEDVQLRNVDLPQKVKDAIETKLEAEQNALAMDYELQKAEKEAERRRVEAGGIADANEIISDSLTQNYLYWHWIENIGDNHVIYVPSEGGFPILTENINKYYEDESTD